MDQKVSSQTNVFVYKKQQSSTDIGSSKFFVDLIKKTIHKDKNVATNLNNPNYKIINENQFVISDYCKICSTKLNGLNLEIRHQCKFCGKSVCGKCSKKKVNNERSCDICFLKISNPNQGKRRREYLKYRENYINQLKNLVKESNLKLQNYEVEILNINTQAKKQQEKTKEEINNLFKEQEKCDDILKKRLENKNRLQQNMETEKSILLQKTIENERLKNNIEGLNNEILEKEQAINLKKNSLFDLLDQDEKLKDSNSFILMENDQRKISNEDLFTGTTTPSFSRKLGTFYETMEKIPEQNESIYEEHKSNESKSSYHGYKTGKSLQLFAVKTLYKLDSESIVKEVQKNKYCCIEKVKKKDEKSSEKTFCEINACRIF